MFQVKTQLYPIKPVDKIKLNQLCTDKLITSDKERDSYIYVVHSFLTPGVDSKHTYSYAFCLKSQGQIWDILQGESSRGV